MRCHTWPPAASAPHMGVRATMSGPPSPAPGWHILIHERAWALSGQNYPYQNATINTFINPTSESTLFFLSIQKNNPSPKSTILPCLCCACACPPACPLWVPKSTHSHICTQSYHWTPYTLMHVLNDHLPLLLCKWFACLSVVGGPAFCS